MPALSILALPSPQLAKDVIRQAVTESQSIKIFCLLIHMKETERLSPMKGDEEDGTKLNV